MNLVRKLAGFILIVAVILGGLYLVFPGIFKTTVTQIKDGEFAEDVREEIMSSPLLGSFAETDAKLSVAGVITETNGERTSRSLRALTENAELTKAATLKLDDLFKQQYFEHISPQGHGPGYLAEEAGYRYVVIGENLALGNFKDDKVLVAAWMASPGHRANILNERYSEIGVAVGQGMYEGRKTWIAVQEFGKPASSCPIISTALKSSIEREKENVGNLDAQIQSDKRALESMPRGTPAERDAYNAKVSEYNATVKEYNTAVSDLRRDIDAYNEQVRVFNSCIRQ
jgi:uncharacterized protein YkwD